MPTLSILTPVKNAAPWVAECIQSGLNQSFQDWEWIFVDDHSTDDSASIIAEFTGKDSRIKLFTNLGRGIIPALQKALAESSGRFISRMDADDLMPPGRLAKMDQALQSSPPKTIVTGLVEYFSKGEESPGYRKYQNWLNGVLRKETHWQNIYRECVVASPNWMIRKDDLAEIGGFYDLDYPEDYDLVFRWYQNDFQLEVIPEVTLHWREHPGRTSRNSGHYNQQSFYRLKIKRFLELNYDPARELCLWGTGIKSKLAAELLKNNGIRFHWMGLTTNNRSHIQSYRQIEKLEKPQLLIAVYPPEKQMKDMLQYLNETGLEEGKNYWFL